MANDREFDSLTATNYPTWAYRMEMRLVKLDLWDIVDGSTTTPNVGPTHTTMLKFLKKQRLAKAEIVQYVSDSQLVHTKSTDPHEIWEKLKTVHNARGFGTRMSLRRYFHKMRYDDFATPTMRTWITAVEEVVQRIRDLDGDVPDEDIIVVLTESLPESYQPLIVTFDSLAEDELTPNHVISRLITEESRQDRAETPGLALASSASALAARSPASPRVKRDVKDITCFKCRKKGHYQSNCPDNDTAPVPPYSAPLNKPTGRMF